MYIHVAIPLTKTRSPLDVERTFTGRL